MTPENTALYNEKHVTLTEALCYILLKVCSESHGLACVLIL